ncbi:MAG: S1C family serine protease [Planctomycetota bacterium]|jgi:membrane-associated protease RseP (regulator of RpoE activity)
MSVRTPTLALSLILALAASASAQDRDVAESAAVAAERGYIGIQPAELTEEARQHFKVAKEIQRGLVLTRIYEGTAAAKAGLRVGDILTSFNNKPVNSIEDLMKALQGMRPGRKVAYVARRGSGTIAGLIVLGKRPAEARERAVEIIEETPIPAPKADDLDKRLDKLNRDIEILRKRAEAKRAAAKRKTKKKSVTSGFTARKHPAGKNRLMEYLEREELGLVKAEKSGNQKAAAWHRARLQLLRELSKAGIGTEVPSGARVAPNRNAERRMRQLEERLHDVLERLEALESKRDRR